MAEEVSSQDAMTASQCELVRYLWAQGGQYSEMLSVLEAMYAGGTTGQIFGSPLEQIRALARWNRRAGWQIHESEIWKALPPPTLASQRDILLLAAFWETPLDTWQRYASVVEARTRAAIGFDSYMEMYAHQTESRKSMLEWWRLPSQGAPLSIAQAVDRGELPSHVLAAALALSTLK